MVASMALGLEYVKDADIKSYILLGVAALGIMNGLIGSLTMHFKFAELSGVHRSVSESWNALMRRIELCLKKPKARRPAMERFLEEISADFSRLSESSPEIPTVTVNMFRYTFAQDMEDGMAVAHFLNGLHPLNPYEISEDEAQMAIVLREDIQ
jgi:hypothetical protein